MENEIVDRLNLTQKITNLIKKYKKLLFVIFLIVIITLSTIIFLNYYQKNKNERISEKYIIAGIYLSSEKKEDSKLLYKEIILSKNKFYSILALNKILENNLEQNKDEVLNFFEIIEDIKNDKEQKNLIKFKKALYLIKISKEIEGEELLRQIIEDNSIWKNAAIKISEK